MAIRPQSEHSSHPISADSSDKLSSSTLKKIGTSLSKVISPQSSSRKISATHQTDSASNKGKSPNTVPDKAHAALGYDDLEEFNCQDADNQTSIDQLISRPGSVASHPEIGFVLQADMAYENDFVSEVVVPNNARLEHVAVAPSRFQTSAQIAAEDKRKQTPVRMRRARDAFESSGCDTESVKSCASFVRSRAATLRLAAERLNAVQGRANRVTSAPQDTEARLMKSYGEYKEYDKLCELVLGQRNTSGKRWSKEVIKSLTDVFMDKLKASVCDKFDQFMAKLRRSSFNFDERQYCILFVGVHLMQCLVSQNKWHSAFKILEVLIDNKVPIHRLSSDALRNCESTKLAVKICFNQKRYIKLSEMLANLKYFKDSSAISKRVGSLNVVLVESLKEVTTTAHKFEVCEIGFNLIKCIVSSYDRDKEIQEFVDGKFLDMKSFAVFSSLSAGLKSYDLLLKFCKLQSDHPLLLNWMSLPMSLPQIVKCLASSPNSLCLTEAVRLAKLAADQQVYPPVVGGDRLALSSAMSKEEIVVMLLAHMREEARVRHAASKSLVGKYNFIVHFIHDAGDDNFDTEKLASYLNIAIRETFLVGELRNTSGRMLRNSFNVELSDFYTVVKRLMCVEVGTKCYSSSGSSSVSRSIDKRHNLTSCNSYLGYVPPVRKPQSDIDSPLSNVNHWPTMPSCGSQLKENETGVPYSSSMVPTPKPPLFAIPKAPPPSRKVLLQTPKSPISAPVLLPGAKAVTVTTHETEKTVIASVNNQFGSVQLSGNSPSSGYGRSSSNPQQSTPTSGSSMNHCVPSLLSLNCPTPKNSGLTKDVGQIDNFSLAGVVQRGPAVPSLLHDARQSSRLGASATITSNAEFEIDESASMEFPERKLLIANVPEKQQSNHHTRNQSSQLLHQNESFSRVSPNQQTGSSRSAELHKPITPGTLMHSVGTYKVVDRELSSMPEINERWSLKQPELVTQQLQQQSRFAAQRLQKPSNQQPEPTKQQMPSRSSLQQYHEVNSIMRSEQSSRSANQQLHQSQLFSSQHKNVPWSSSQHQVMVPLTEKGESFNSRNQQQPLSSVSQVRNTCSFSQEEQPMRTKRQSWPLSQQTQPVPLMDLEQPISSMRQQPRLASEQHREMQPVCSSTRQEQVPWLSSEQQNTMPFTQQSQISNCGPQVDRLTSQLSEETFASTQQRQPRLLSGHRQNSMSSTRQEQQTSLDQSQRSWSLQRQPEPSVQYQQLPRPSSYEQPGLSSQNHLSSCIAQGQPRKSPQEQSAQAFNWQQSMPGSLKHQHLMPSPDEPLNTISQASPLPYAAGQNQFRSSISSPEQSTSSPQCQSPAGQSSFPGQLMSHPFSGPPRQPKSQTFLLPKPSPVLHASKAELPAQHIGPALTEYGAPNGPRQTSSRDPVRMTGKTLLARNPSEYQPALPVASRETAASYSHYPAKPSGPQVAVQNKASEPVVPSQSYRSPVNPTQIYSGQPATVRQYRNNEPATDYREIHRDSPTMPSRSTSSGGTRVYRTIAEEVSGRVKEHVRNGVIAMSDVAISEFVSIIAGNFYDQCRRESSTGAVVLSDETFDSLERHVDSQVELRRQHSEFVNVESDRRW